MPVTRAAAAIAAAVLLPAALSGQVPKECRSERPYPPTGYVVEAPFDPFRNAWPDSVIRLLHETEALPPGSRLPALEAAAARWPRAALLPALAMLIADGTGTIEIVGPDLDDLIDLYRSLDGPAAPLLWVAEGAGTLDRRLPVLRAMPQRITPSDAVVLLRWGCQAGWLLAKVSENDLKGWEVIPPQFTMRESETFASVYVLLGPGRRRALDELMPLINDRLGVSARVEYKERMRRNESPGGPPP